MSQARTRYTTPRSRHNRDARRGPILGRHGLVGTRGSLQHDRRIPAGDSMGDHVREQLVAVLGGERVRRVDEDHIERRRLRGAASSIGVRGRACALEATYFSALALMTRAVMPRSHERFRCSAVNVLAISAAAGAEDSTATSSLAPRLNASTPSAPVPANRSNTRASSSTCHESRCENIASLVRSVVGRVPVFGVVNATPLNRPEITCMTPLWPPRRNDRNRTTGPGSYVPYIRRLRYATQLAHMPHML